MNNRNYDEFSKIVNLEFGKAIANVDKSFHLSLVGSLGDKIYECVENFLEKHNVAFVSFPVLYYCGNDNFVDRNSVYFWDKNGNEIMHLSRGIGCSSCSRIWAKSFLDTMKFEVYSKTLNLMS